MRAYLHKHGLLGLASGGALLVSMMYVLPSAGANDPAPAAGAQVAPRPVAEPAQRTAPPLSALPPLRTTATLPEIPARAPKAPGQANAQANAQAGAGAANNGVLPFVVTAPWALEGKTQPANLPKWEPPPLPSTPIPPPLSPEQRALVQATQGDKLPEPTWLRYVVSNEWRHDVVFPKVANLGGVYIGVATDQNYTVAAAARTELLVLMDYDSEVVNMHRIYHAFIAQSETAQEMRALFQQKNATQAAELLMRTAATPELGKKLVRTYNTFRERVAIYLFHVAHIKVGTRMPSWLGDPEAYAYIRGLVQGGRVLAIQGDLNGTVALRSIGDTARALKLPVRIFYTSNAESFFKYNPQFRANIGQLPHDDKSVMLRTFKHGMTAPIGDLWHYCLHQIDDFLGRLENPAYNNVYRVMVDLERKGGKQIEATGVSYYDGSVPRT